MSKIYLSKTKNICIICNEYSNDIINLHKTRRQYHSMCLECYNNFISHNLNVKLDTLYNDFTNKHKGDNSFLTLKCPGCMNKKCDKVITNFLLNIEEFNLKYELINLYINNSNSLFCRNKNCKDIIIIENGYENKEIKCISCNSTFCKDCKHIPFHTNKSCLEFELEDKKSENISYINDLLKEGKMKLCPNCKVPTIKESGCNKMLCQSCNIKWCWLCSTLKIDYDHFNLENNNTTCKGKLWEGVIINQNINN